VPYTIRQLEDGKGVLSYGSGKVTFAEIERAKQELARSPDLTSPKSYLIIDLADTTDLDLSGAEIQATAESTIRLFPTLFSPDAKAAVIAPTDMLFGLSRMWEVFVEKSRLQVQVFRSRADAEQWVRPMGTRSGSDSS
jgi:hypothetical protein